MPQSITDRLVGLQALGLSPPRHFRNLPKEVRNKIYYFLFEHAPGTCYQTNQPIIDATLASLHEVDKGLWKEALWIRDRFPSTPQRVNLNKKTLATVFGQDVPPQRGFPQRRVDGHDWLNLQYLVLKIPYADASFRNEFEKPTLVQFRIPSVLGDPLEQMIEFFGKNEHSTLQNKLARVRYDLVQIPKIGSGKGAKHIIRVTKLSRVFPYAMQVWAEAAGPFENGIDMEVVRAFNISRRFFEGGRRVDLEESVASAGANGGIDIRKGWDHQTRKELRVAKKVFKAMRKEPDSGYWNRQGNFVDGERVAIQCGNCYAKFLSQLQVPPGRLDSWKVYDTRREYNEHRHRAAAHRGALALC